MTRTPDPIARHTQWRRSAGRLAHRPADEYAEELKLRQRVCEVFSGSVKRDHVPVPLTRSW